jgi:hypothetical protein
MHNMINPVWDMNKQAWVELRPYMQFVPHIQTRSITEEQWEVALKLSVSDTEWTAILEARKRSGK